MTEETPIHKRAVVFTMPGQDSVYIERDIVYNSIGDQDLLLDVYRPSTVDADQFLPGVIFIHGSDQ